EQRAEIQVHALRIEDALDAEQPQHDAEQHDDGEVGGEEQGNALHLWSLRVDPEISWTERGGRGTAFKAWLRLFVWPGPAGFKHTARSIKPELRFRHSGQRGVPSWRAGYEHERRAALDLSEQPRARAGLPRARPQCAPARRRHPGGHHR